MERNLYKLACKLATEAVEHHIQSRRGIWHLEREDLLCIYDNNPYDDDPGARPRQNLRIIQRLRDLGIATLAVGHDASEYTTVILADCSWDRISHVSEVVSEEVEETLRELYSDP